MNDFTLIAVFTLLLLLACLGVWRTRSSRRLPPGPKGFPLLGNVLDIPSSFEWRKYHEWCNDLGTDILHLSITGTTVIVLDTVEVASELLERRSSIYSGRPRMPMLVELMGWDVFLGFMPYGKNWRRHRRPIAQALHPKSFLDYRAHALKATHKLLCRISDCPGDLEIMAFFRHFVSEVIMTTTYGLDMRPENMGYVKSGEDVITGINTVSAPGAYWVNLFPFMKYIPAWIPGAGFKHQAKMWREVARIAISDPFEAVKKNGNIYTSVPSLVSSWLQKHKQQQGLQDDEEAVIQASAAAMFGAGSDTTLAALTSCILGLLENPDVLKKAQFEIDTVVTNGCLPTFDDEKALPYITAIVREALRWKEIVPFAIPHRLEVEDEYCGYRLPAGSTIIPNIWAMLHNEDMYPDPFSFKPERFMENDQLNESVMDPTRVCFGLGRRICPGRYLAYSTTWIAVASMLSVFDFHKTVEGDGTVKELSHEYATGMVCLPKPFNCSVKLRSHIRAETVQNLVSSHDA